MSLTADDIRNCTMIAMDQPPWWPEKVDNKFKFTVRITDAYTSCRLQEIIPEGRICTVDWDDGTIDERVNPQTTHAYNSPGTYQVTITYPLVYPHASFMGWGTCFFTPAASVVSIDTKFPKIFKDSINFYIGRQLFSGCSSLLTIPKGLFDYWPNIGVTLSRCFYGCSSLRGIPTGLFKSCIGVVDFSRCFYGCSSLQEIPTNLFRYCEEATDFSYCFYGCSGLQTMADGIFDYCTGVTDFSHCFDRCTSLQEIPSGLFDSCVHAWNFSYCFYRCFGLQEIPLGLFDSCTEVTTFSYCFYYCIGLKGIPPGLFDSCTEVTNFDYCFYNCYNVITIPSNLFGYNNLIERIEHGFDNCRMATSVPALWVSHPSIRLHTQCFYRCYAASNYQNIPSDWK